MKATITIPKDLEDLVKEALESGEYDSLEQIVTDALWLWADAADAEPDEDALADEDADEALLAAFEAKKP
jgi:Arc/MetJ-type ribon-helix-helix transcriptional regulator